jgi:hypothetical protein
MIPVSQRFLNTITGPHVVTVTADVLRSGQILASNLPVGSGSITASRAQAVRRTCNVTISDPDYRARSTTDPLAPYGQELRLRVNVVYPEGETESVPVGVFDIQESDDGWPYAGVTVQGSSREQTVSDDRFLTPRIGENPSQQSMIRQLLGETVPWAGFSTMATRDAPLVRVKWNTDRWQAVADMATALAAEVYADPMGQFRLVDVPTTSNTAVWTVAAGDGGALVRANRKLKKSALYNAVIATGQAPDGTQIVGDPQMDTDPTSPTCYGAPVKRPTFYSSPLLASLDQCNSAARAMLADTLGAGFTVDLTAATNYALEPGDVIAVGYPDGDVERHLADQIQLGWGSQGATMSLTTRSTAYRG